ncbi:hypothetical protein [Hyphobacterium sp.]|jgi:flagellar basal body rod protein FlgC|uniref:hypothetical protein n=1 Tax=Hyphobacterium sp. TaxID=2004662 RepID=UPI003BAD4E70
MNIAFNTSAAALQAAEAQLASAARDIANPRADEAGIIDAMVAIKEAEASQAASAAVIRTASDMTGRLLDILA